MNNNIKIYYNNIDLFSGIGPTPFISTDQEFINFNNTWNQVTNISMNGQLTGRYLGQLSFYEINSGLNLLVSRLSNNYGSLVISENNETLFSGDNVIVDNINSDQSNWYGILPFTIDFQVYETGFFTNYYGVVEPEENISFSEDNGYIVNLTHTISAKGLKTGNNNAIESAKNWVNTRTGNYNKIIPIWARTGNGSKFLLNSVKNTVDRFNGVYTFEANYIKSTFYETPQNAILNYNININSGIQDGIITIGVEGSLSNNEITGSTSLRSEFLNYNFYNIANQIATQTFNTTLNNNPITQSITEEQNNNVLNFNLVFNNDLTSNIVNDYNVKITTDPIKNITNVNFDSKISAKYGDIDTRWALVQNYYNNNFYPYSLSNNEYQKEVSGKQLYSTPLTESTTFDEYNAQILYNASWSDKRPAYSDNVLQLTSTIKYNPAIYIYVVNTSCAVPREHNIQNLICANLSTLDINVSATAKPSKNINFAIQEVNSELERIKNNYNILSKKFTLKDRKVTTNNSAKTYSIQEIYSYQGDILT